MMVAMEVAIFMMMVMMIVVIMLIILQIYNGFNFFFIPLLGVQRYEGT